jgi:WD40 repeat protein
MRRIVLLLSVAFSPDGKVLAVGSQEDEHIKLFDTATGELLHSSNRTPE